MQGRGNAESHDRGSEVWTRRFLLLGARVTSKDGCADA